MTDQQHPITIPPELEEELLGLWPKDALQRAAQWGANQELEACCKWLKGQRGEALAIHLRTARRPKPKSLAEVALEEVGVFEGMGTCNIDIIRRALERLQELEGQGND